MKSKYLILMSVSGLVIALDQLTKLLIYTNFRLGESLPVIQDIFHFTYVRNFGAAFGFLANTNPAFRDVFFLAIPPLALLVILSILRGVAESEKLEIFALSAVFGGAIGNYIDRIHLGFVVDFFDFHYYNKFAYPAFNIADISIVCGICVLALLMYRNSKKPVAKK